MNKLSVKEMFELIEAHNLEEGDKIRLNHDNDECTGGRDCAIFERKPGGIYAFYCFRCGCSGFVRTATYFKSPRKKDRHGDSGTHSLSELVTGPPADAHGDWHRIPREPREWLIRGGVNSTVLSSRGVLWSESKEKLYLPVSQAGVNMGWVCRGFSPKYYRVMGENRRGLYGYYLTDNVINNGKIMIVEDTLSAWKTSEVIDSISLLGTDTKDNIISLIMSKRYHTAYIWLDADNPTVRMKARAIAKKLMSLNTRVIETNSDPKYHTLNQIEELLK